MRIVHYLNHAHAANGHVAVAVDLACEQAETGHDVHFVSGECDFRPALEKHGVRFHRVKDRAGKFRVLQMTWDLYPVLRTIRPDVVNAHMVAASLAAKIVRSMLRFGLVTTVHNAFDRQAILMRVGDRVIAVSEAVKSQMASRGIPERKLRIVRNGTIGGGRRDARLPEAATLRRPAITTVAGLHDRKGIVHLISAFDLLFSVRRDVHLYLVGDGPQRARYEAFAKQKGSAGNIHFMGHLDDPRSVLASTDVFTLASLQDPFPLVLSEAREMGCAIVATRVDGIPEALWQGAKGVLVPPADPDSLAAALLDLITDGPKRAALAAAAAADTDEITVRRMSAQTLLVYGELMSSAVRSRSDRRTRADTPSG